MSPDDLFQDVDLMPAMYGASFAGLFLSIYVMQRSWTEIGDNFLIGWVRRGALTLYALCLMWGLSYAEYRNWEPWPPALAVLIAVDLMLLARAVVLYRRSSFIAAMSLDEHRKHHHSFFRVFYNALAFAIMLAVLIIFGMAIDRGPPFVRQSGMIEPANPRPGDWIRVIWSAEKRRDCTGEINRIVRDLAGTPQSFTYFLPSTIAIYSMVPSGNSLVREFQLPAHMRCGPAEYQAIATYSCNALQHIFPITVPGPTVKFNVSCDKP